MPEQDQKRQLQVAIKKSSDQKKSTTSPDLGSRPNLNPQKQQTANQQDQQQKDSQQIDQKRQLESEQKISREQQAGSQQASAVAQAEEQKKTDQGKAKQKKTWHNIIDLIRYLVGGSSGIGEGCCSAPCFPFMIFGPLFHRLFIKNRTEAEKKDDQSMFETLKLWGLLGCQAWSCLVYLGILLLFVIIIFIIAGVFDG